MVENEVEVKSRRRNYKQISSSSSCSSSDSSNDSGRFKNIVVSLGGVLSATNTGSVAAIPVTVHAIYL